MTSTTYTFAFLIFQLCRDVSVTIWNCDTILCLVGTVDIGLIKDEANVVVPQRGPGTKMHLLRDNLVDTIGRAQGTEPDAP